MARIRSIHPGLASDESYMAMTIAAKAAWPLLWMECDDKGVFEWKPLVLKARIFPADNVNFADILSEWEGLNCVKQFTVDGKTYGAVRNFRKFQRPKTPNDIHPAPTEIRNYVGLRGDISEMDEVKPDQFPPEGEKSPQMEDGGGRMEDEGEREESRAPELKFWDEVQGYLSRPDDLTDWEINFLHSIKKLNKLTKAQTDALNAIRGKMQAAAKPNTEPIPITIIREGTPEWEELKKTRPRLVARDIQTPNGIIRGEYGRAA